MAKKQYRKTGKAPELIEYQGESKSALDWADTLHISVDTFRNRWRRFQKGMMATIDDVFVSSVGKYQGKQTADALAKPVTKGMRTRATAHLFELYEEICKPHLRDEMKMYMATGEMGPAMKFFQLYKDFFPKDRSELLDGDTSTPVATVAVVINSTSPTPQDITIIDQ